MHLSQVISRMSLAGISSLSRGSELTREIDCLLPALSLYRSPLTGSSKQVVHRRRQKPFNLTMASAALSALMYRTRIAQSSPCRSILLGGFSPGWVLAGREHSGTWFGECRASIHGDAGQESAAVSLVQGASRGLGLEFVKQLLSRSADSNVIATCRNPDGAEKLIALKEQYCERLSVLPLDVTVESSIEAAAKAVQSSHGRLDLLVNTAGILQIASVVQPETSLSRLELQAMLLTYQVNAAGPLLVTKHMWPLLKRGKESSRAPAVVANLSARVGSIGDNQIGGWYSYRASKSALNQLTKTASIESARQKASIVFILLHPGTVNTDLSKPFQRNVPKEKLFTPDYSVTKLLAIIDKADLSYNGKFFAWDGQQIAW